MTSHEFKLKLTFTGVCTHFRHGVAAGVPHRVVLPDAANVHVGFLNVVEAPETEPLPYSLLPHFPQLQLLHSERPLDVPALTKDGGPAMTNGDIHAGVRLHVANALEREMVYEDDDTPRLTDYVKHYAFSQDVVLNGRAACYFDLYGGRMRSFRQDKGAWQAEIEVTTAGPPELIVTPLASGGPARAYSLMLAGALDLKRDVQLLVQNNELFMEGATMDGQTTALDFLLNYLTASGGIPQVIQKLMPGMQAGDVAGASPEAIAMVLATLKAPRQGRRTLVPPDELTPACSDSTYP